MTPLPTVGDPVTLVTRLQPPARVLRNLEGVVESIDGDRASVRWADGARSSARLQFLRPVLEPGLAEALERAADRAEATRAIARSFDVPLALLEKVQPGKALTE